MKMAFILMAYKDPQQIKMLLDRMNHDSFHFFIHVDKKSNLEEFKFLESMQGVFFTSIRNRINWAGYSFTKTVIACMQEILKGETNYDFISSFSGQDYPIKINEEIVQYYNEHIGKSFFSLESQSSTWWKEAESRYCQYHMTDFSFKGRYIMQRILNTVLPKRKFDFFEQVYGGPRATWWTISTQCGEYVVNFFNSNKKLRFFCKFCWAPDEYLIPSIVMNSKFSNSVLDDSGRYIDWSLGGANPKILTSNDFTDISTSTKIFARKFDINVDTDIYDLLDNKAEININ